MNIYLSGPMKGKPHHNHALFNEVAGILREQGHYVYNPAERDIPKHPKMPDLRLAFFDYFKFICLEADAIVMLPGWARSDGATAEMQAAKCCGVKIVNWAGQSGSAVDSVAALLEGAQ